MNSPVLTILNYRNTLQKEKLCSYCGKSIGYHNLRRHERNIHKIKICKRKIYKRDEKKVQCDHCGIKFAYKKNLARHLQDIHHFVFEKRIPKNGFPRIEILDANTLVKEVSSLTKTEFVCVRGLLICFQCLNIPSIAETA